VKLLVTLFAGLLLGAVLALGLLYVNPFSRGASEAVVVGEDPLVLVHEAPPAGAAAFTRGPLLDWPTRPTDVPELWETAIDTTAAALLAPTREDGSPGAAVTRFSVPSADSRLLTRGLLLDNVWLVTFADDSGTAFVASRENVWPAIRDAVLPASRAPHRWEGRLELAPAAGPGPLGVGTVQGLNGEIAGRRGELVTRYELIRYAPETGPAGEVTLELAWEPAAAE
jgi:hypothetical protein